MKLVITLILNLAFAFSIAQSFEGDSLNVKVSKEKKSRNQKKKSLESPLAPPLQIDSPVYHVKLKTGKDYYCNIISMAEGNFMSVKNFNGSIIFLQWEEIE